MGSRGAGQGSSIGEKGEAILRGAMQEFLAHGYAGASMDGVARAAGVSKATVYSHYGDKAGLFVALAQHLVRNHMGETLHPEEPAPWEGEPPDVLRRFAHALLDALMGDPQLLAFARLIIAESGRFPMLAHAFVRASDAPIMERLARYLASRPELRLRDPAAVAHVVFGALFYFAIAQELLGGNEVVPLERDRLVESLVALVAAHAAPTPRLRS